MTPKSIGISILLPKYFPTLPRHWEWGKLLTSHNLQDESCISLLFSPLKLAPKANTKTKIKYFFKQYNGDLFTTLLHIKYKHIKHTQRHVLLNAMISYHFNNVCGGSSHQWSLTSFFLQLCSISWLQCALGKHTECLQLFAVKNNTAKNILAPATLYTCIQCIRALAGSQSWAKQTLLSWKVLTVSKVLQDCSHWPSNQ